jgi:hypothetical protein
VPWIAQRLSLRMIVDVAAIGCNGVRGAFREGA